MKKRKSFNLIIILTIVILAVGLGVWKFNERFKISFVDNKLISCREHIDKDLDMFCDVCHLELTFSNYAEIKTVKAGDSGENKLEIYGYMPKTSEANIIKVSDTSAVNTAKRYKKDILDEEVIAGFDISLNYNNKKYEPSKYSQKVDVKISNLDLDTSKTYALLHIIDDSNYEILPIKEMTKDEITFTTGSFSTYIIITVGTNTVTFDGENFKILDTNGNEITNGATVASGTDFSFNIVPNNYYGITGVTCSTADAMSSYGDIKGKACYISSISENMTITVTTAIAPSITTHPVSVKVKQGSSTKFSVVANDATTYEWQYRENKSSLWKSVTSTLGGSYTSANFTLTSTGYEVSGYEFRCLVGNANFTAHERVKSDIATVSVTQDDLVVGETPIIMVQPNMDSSKVKINSGRATYSVTAMGGTDMTFTWQYRENRDEYWKTVTSSVASTSTSTPSNSTTAKPLKKSTLTTVAATYSLSGYEFRCLVGNTFYTNHDVIKSDIVSISVADDDLTLQGRMLNLKITAQPESQKVKLGDKATFSVTAVEAGTYKWQYLPSGEELWQDVTSTMSSTYNKASMVIDTSSMTEEDSLSGARFRCVVSSSVVSGYTKTSDEAMLSVVQGTLEKDISYAKVISPKDVTVFEGKEASFTTGLDPAVSGLKYEWHEVNGDSDINLATENSNYIGADTETLTIPADLVTLSKNGYKYYCDIGGIVTDKATLTVMEYNITDISSDEITITLPSEKIVYNAIPRMLNLVIKHGDKILVSGTDYTVTYKNNINIGMATLTITGINLYEGTRDINFLINKRDITIKPKDEHKTYDGTALTSNIAEVSEGSLANGHTAEITTTGSIIDVGSVENKISQLTIKDGSNTDVSENYNITKASGILTVYADSGVNFNITLDKNSYEYDGTAKTPNVTVKVESKVLTKDVDYEVKYTNNVDAGTATVIVTGIGNYKGSAGSSYFTITKRAIEITAGSKSKVYDGTALTCATFSITSSNKLAANQTLSATTFGTISNVGTTENVIVTCKVFASGIDVTSNYSITSKAGTLEIKKADVTGSIIINGTNVVGETLSVEPDLTPANVALTYEWYYNDTNTTSNGTKISEGKTLTLTDDLAGKYIYVVGKTNSSNYNAKTFEAITTNEKNYSDIVKSGSAPILMGETSANVYTNGYIFGNSSISARRSNVTSIVIKDNVDGVSDSTISWDVSRVKDRSVTAWLVPNGSNYTLYIGAEGKIIVSNGYALFAEYSNCTSITGLVNLTTYEVTNMSRMFSNLSKVTSLDVSTLDTASCGDFSYMFNGCSALTSLNVSKFDTIRATNMKMMFNGVSKVNALNVSGFDTVNVRDMSGMFKGCSSVSGLDVSLFDTTNVENMASMFNGCSSLTSLDVTGFITTSVKSMGRIFKDCSKLTRLDLCSFDLSKLDGSTYLETLNGVNDINEVEMFKGCTSLKSILLGKHFARINGANMFDGCSALNIIIAQSETPMSLSTDTGLNTLTNAIIYVPNDSSYTNYLKANNYSSVFGDRRIKTMLEVLGEGKVTLYYGDTYTSAGALVAGCAESSKDIYESYGYTLEVTGLPVDTTVIGIHKVKFILKYMNTTVDSM